MKLILIVVIVCGMVAACDDTDQSGWTENKTDTVSRGTDGWAGKGVVDTTGNDPDSGLGDIDPQSNCASGESGCWNENLMQCVNGIWQFEQNCSIGGGWCWLSDGTHVCMIDTLPDSALYDTSTAEPYVDTASLFTTDLTDTDSILGIDSETDAIGNIDFDILCDGYCDQLETCDLITNDGLPMVTSIGWNTAPLTCQAGCVGEITRLRNDAAFSDCSDAILATTVCYIALPCPEMQRYIDGDDEISELPCGKWHRKYLDACH